MKKFILLIVILFILCGCSDYRELNDMAVVSGIAIDYKDNKYNVMLEIIKSEKSSDGTKIKTEVIDASDKILANAFYKVKNRSNNETYLGHVSLVVISESLAKHGIYDVIDYILRDIEISNDYSIVVSNNINLFDIKLENEGMSQKVNNHIKVSLGTGVTVDMVGNKLLNDRIDLIIPYLEINGKDININKIAYFKEDKLENIINNKIYNFLMLDNLDFNFNKDINVINVYDKDVSFDVKKDKIIVNIECNGKVKDIEEEYNLDEYDSYQRLEKLISKKIDNDVTKFLNEYKDLVGFNDMYYKKYNKNKNISKFEVNVNLRINKNGAIYEVLYD